MKNVQFKLAVLGTLGIASMHVMATGFVNLPTTGFGTSAYTLCNTTGNFGSSITVAPTASANNTCAVFPAAETISPIAGYGVSPTNVINYSATRPAIMNNTYTGGVDKQVGSVTEYVWRSRTTPTECIYGAKFIAINTDYNPSAGGDQYFEMNDFARGGFSGLTVDIAYFRSGGNSEVLFRAGRTFTSVQHRASSLSSSTPGTGYLSLPGLTPSTASINGLNSWPLATPTAAEQSAVVNDNWVDFTTDANFLDDDTSTKPASSMLYVKAACPATGEPPAKDEAIRLRQTAQENTNFIEVSVRGYVPDASSSVTPAHVNPF